MPFISRDKNNKISGIYNQKRDDATEEISPTNIELLNFLFNEKTQAHTKHPELSAELMELRLSDLGLIRVLEDLINVLLEKDVIQLTDLPEAAINRLRSRQAIRKRIDMISNVLDDDSS